MRYKFLLILTLIFFAGTYLIGADMSTHVLGAIKRELLPSTGTVQAGYYAATTLQNVDTDLIAGNIKNNICIFNTTGTYKSHELPDTGQFKCYDNNGNVLDPPPTSGQAFYGQDSQYNPTSSSPSFTDNGDGTITDNVTGLMWIENSTDTAVGIWQCSWEVALSSCENLNYAGYTDWRLPSLKELLSIVDYSRFNPAINRTYFKGIFGNYYWTSTTVASYGGNAWFVHFSNGMSNVDGKLISYYVRPVRGGQ